MTDSNTQSAGKMLTRASVYGTVSLALYFLLYFFEDFILEFTSRGGWYFIAPVAIAFVLTPAMMSMGVPGIVAVASNICHKFPKALVGAIKRAKYGQVDVKLGIVVGISAEAGVLYGAHIQEIVHQSFGDAGSNLYVSLAFVVVLGVVGSYVLWDAIKMRHTAGNEPEKASCLARWVQSIHIPGT